MRLHKNQSVLIDTRLTISELPKSGYSGEAFLIALSPADLNGFLELDVRVKKEVPLSPEEAGISPSPRHAMQGFSSESVSPERRVQVADSTQGTLTLGRTTFELLQISARTERRSGSI